jgi:hypothetical protein
MRILQEQVSAEDVVSPEAPPPIERRWMPPWVGASLLILALALLPWSWWLSVTLPRTATSHHWRLAWVGFDSLLALALALTAWGLFRRSAWVLATAGATAALLVSDAWFDVLTSPAGSRWIAILQAITCELPLAVACLIVARNAERAFERTRLVAEAAHRLILARARRARFGSPPLP